MLPLPSKPAGPELSMVCPLAEKALCSLLKADLLQGVFATSRLLHLRKLKQQDCDIKLVK